MTDVPITYLGYVNRDTGVIEEPGHLLDGIPIRDTVLIYPKGSGSTVAPFVLMGLIYRIRAQSNIEQGRLPAHPSCSIPLGSPLRAWLRGGSNNGGEHRRRGFPEPFFRDSFPNVKSRHTEV